MPICPGNNPESDSPGMGLTNILLGIHFCFSLDEEMEAGRSKLAKLRERIRRAKGAIKEADEALQKKS